MVTKKRPDGSPQYKLHIEMQHEDFINDNNVTDIPIPYIQKAAQMGYPDAIQWLREHHS